MNIYRIVGTVAQAWIYAIQGIRYGRVREPFFVIAGLQLVMLILLGYFHHPWLAGALTPVVRFLGGDAATHYPEHFWRLPEILRGANAMLMVCIGVFAYAAAARGFAALPSRWTTAFRRADALIPIAVIGIGATWAITSAFNLVPTEIIFRSSIIRLGLQAIELGLIAVVQLLLAFVPLFVVLEGARLGDALRGSWRMCRAYPFQVLLLVAVPLGLLFPPTFFLHEMNLAEAGLVPEAVGLLMTALVVLRVLFDVVVVGGATFLFLGRPGSRS